MPSATNMTSPITVELPADPLATERFGAWLGARLRPGAVLGLVGEMGSGKTTLVRGLARGLRVHDPDAVSSPTYLLVVEHAGPVRLLHADAYLPGKLLAFLEDGGLEYLLAPDAVVVVEWADAIAPRLPRDTLWLAFARTADGGRRLELRTAAVPPPDWLASAPGAS
jgi:tRNA threonylcarbamoyladenosine biosynthesis protein TsaE